MTDIPITSATEKIHARRRRSDEARIRYDMSLASIAQAPDSVTAERRASVALGMNGMWSPEDVAHALSRFYHYNTTAKE